MQVLQPPSGTLLSTMMYTSKSDFTTFLKALKRSGIEKVNELRNNFYTGLEKNSPVFKLSRRAKCLQRFKKRLMFH